MIMNGTAMASQIWQYKKQHKMTVKVKTKFNKLILSRTKKTKITE